jgi:hypothetical protein
MMVNNSMNVNTTSHLKQLNTIKTTYPGAGQGQAEKCGRAKPPTL